MLSYQFIASLLEVKCEVLCISRAPVICFLVLNRDLQPKVKQVDGAFECAEQLGPLVVFEVRAA